MSKVQNLEYTSFYYYSQIGSRVEELEQPEPPVYFPPSEPEPELEPVEPVLPADLREHSGYSHRLELQLEVTFPDPTVESIFTEVVTWVPLTGYQYLCHQKIQLQRNITELRTCLQGYQPDT